MVDRQIESAAQLLHTASERLEDASDEFPAFNILSTLQLERYETRVHSRIIFFLLNSSRKGKDSFLHFFLQTLRVPRRYLNESWNVYRERTFDGGASRIDFVLESRSFRAIVEMKVDAADGDSQLARYAAFGGKNRKEYAIYYLTIDGHIPEEQSVKGVDTARLRCISFEKEVAAWLQKCMSSVDKDGYRYAFLKQYLGTVNQITGIEDEVVSVKDLLDNSDMARAAQAVMNSFLAKMDDVKAEFFQKLNKGIKRRTKLETCLYLDGVDVLLGSFTRKKKTYYVTFGVFIDTYLYACFGFSEKTEGGGYGFIPLADAEAFFPAAYKKWTGKLDALEILPKQNKLMRWEYLEDSEGARLNFKDNSAQIKLIDEMDKQCKFIVDGLVRDFIRPLLD